MMDNNIFFEAAESFSVPVSIVDSYLNAPETELRLILFLLRKRASSFRKDDLLDLLNVDEDRLEKAFAFWCNAGVLFKANNKYMLEKPKIQTSDVVRYTPDDIAARITENEKIRFLFSTAEKAFGRALTPTDSSVVLSLVDWIGLRPEVAMMLIEFCGLNKKSMSRMQRIAVEWAEKDITTIDLAEEYITSETDRKDAVEKVAKRLGFAHRALTETEAKLFYRWTKEYGYNTELLFFAYELSIKNSGKYSYKYMETTIDRWHELGVKTLAEAKKEAEEFSSSKTVKKKSTRSPRKSLAVTEAMEDSWTIISNAVKEDKE